MPHLKLLSFTAGGAALAARICAVLPENMYAERYTRGCDASLKHTSLRRFTQQAMCDCDGIVFIGAAGIAVRSIAPFLQGKAVDPAVLVIDEAGQFVVPLLSGHLGGANGFAEILAQAIGAQAVLTTATDVRGVFAADSWAAAQGFTVIETEEIQYLSAARLRGESIGLVCDFPLAGTLPQGVVLGENAQCGMVVSVSTAYKPFIHTLHIVPQALSVGIGCRRGKPAAQIESVMQQVLDKHHIPKCALCSLASGDIKKDEAGILALSTQYHVPFVTFSAEKLQQAQGTFSSSAFVRQTTGVDNICERAAVLAAAQDKLQGSLYAPKYARDGVTIALAIQALEVSF